MKAAREALRANGWLSHTPTQFRDAVLARCRAVSFAKGQSVYHAGDAEGGLYGLVRGGVAVSIAPGERGPYTAQFLRPGDWFGEANAITRGPRLVGITATCPTELLFLSLKEHDALIGEHHDNWRHFALLTVLNTRVALGAADDLLIRDPKIRCIAVLLRLGGCRYAAVAAQAQPEIAASHEEIAYLTNLSRNAVGSTLRLLERQGLVGLAYRCIRILQPAALLAKIKQHERS